MNFWFLIVLMLPALAHAVPPCENTPPPDQKGCRYYEHRIIYAQTDNTLTVSWAPIVDPVAQAAILHEVEFWTWPNASRAAVVTTVKGAQSAPWQPRRAGFYEVRVRACDTRIPATQQRCSTMATILDGQYTSNNQSWVIFLKLAKPLGGGIE